jgi:hypothetical protein
VALLRQSRVAPLNQKIDVSSFFLKLKYHVRFAARYTAPGARTVRDTHRRRSPARASGLPCGNQRSQPRWMGVPPARSAINNRIAMTSCFSVGNGVETGRRFCRSRRLEGARGSAHCPRGRVTAPRTVLDCIRACRAAPVPLLLALGLRTRLRGVGAPGCDAVHLNRNPGCGPGRAATRVVRPSVVTNG